MSGKSGKHTIYIVHTCTYSRNVYTLYTRHIAEKAVDLHDNARFATIASIWTRILQALELIKTPIAKVSERGGEGGQEREVIAMEAGRGWL